MQITKEIFDKIPDGNIFAVGVIPNSPEGLFMTRSDINRLLLWSAKKGLGNDWAIYCGWLDENSIDSVTRIGDKIHDKNHIKKCVNCTDYVLEKYRE